MLEKFSLVGKTALITGSSSGIGAEIAKTLYLSGANLHLVARRENLLLEQKNNIESLFQSQNHTILQPTINIHPVDLINADIKEFANNINDSNNPVDILFNIAGINKRQPWQEIAIDDWEETIDIHLKIPFFLARELINPMIEKKWGRIINIASLQSVRAFDNSIPYGSAKGGVVQLTRAMAQAWSRYGIAVNAIAPGFFPTDLTAPVFANKQKTQQLAEQTAYKRNGKLEDLNGISIFLSSAASDYITGQTIFVDGGFTAS